MQLKYFLNNVGAFFLTQVMSILLMINQTKEFALNRLDAWADSNKYSRIKSNTSYNLQKMIAKRDKRAICRYCEWSIAPSDTHVYCDLVLKIEAMSDSELTQIWCSLVDYKSTDMYDPQNDISMDAFASLIKSQMDSRGIYSMDISL